MHCIVRRKTSIFFPRISTYSWNGSYISSRTYSRMNIRMKDESRTCRIPANAGREASTVVYVELPHCELFHFTLSPFAEWKLSTSHPSNPVSMHLLLTSYITITPHAAPFRPVICIETSHFSILRNRRAQITSSPSTSID